jgi:hypothetical protein
MWVRFYVMANTAELKRKFNLDTIAVTARRTTHLHIAGRGLGATLVS